MRRGAGPADGGGYDRHAVGSGWEKLLFQQFHDILTGSCVRESREYALGCLQKEMPWPIQLRQQALRALEEKVDTSCFVNPAEDNPLLLGAGAGSGVERGQVSQVVRQANRGRTLFLWNPSAFERREMAEITVWDWSPRDVELLAFYDEKGRQIPHQILTSGFNYYWSHSYVKALIHVAVPAFGYRTLGIRDKDDLPVSGGVLADGCQRLARRTNLCWKTIWFGLCFLLGTDGCFLCRGSRMDTNIWCFPGRSRFLFGS